jgi:hypothetical protein
MIGHGMDDLGIAMQRVGATRLDDVGQYLLGNRPGTLQRQMAVDARGLAKMVPGIGGKAASQIGRFAGRATPLLSAAGNVMDVADIIAGDESFGNKAMDAAGMALGGTAGAFIGGPLGASIGASVGKMGSDGLQWLFGDKKTPDQRKMESALAALNGGLV